MENNKEKLEEELDELYKDLEALEKQYNNKFIKPGSKIFIWDDIKYTKEQIAKKEEELKELTGKTR